MEPKRKVWAWYPKEPRWSTVKGRRSKPELRRLVMYWEEVKSLSVLALSSPQSLVLKLVRWALGRVFGWEVGRLSSRGLGAMVTSIAR